MRAREEGEGRRIQLKKNDITCAARERKREREIERERERARARARETERMGGGVHEARANRRKLH